MAESLDLGVAAWGPLAAGLLTGKHTRREAGAREPGSHRFADDRYAALAERQLAALDGASRPSLGFPQAFLASDRVRRYSTSGHFDRLVNHHAHHYVEFAS